MRDFGLTFVLIAWENCNQEMRRLLGIGNSFRCRVFQHHLPLLLGGEDETESRTDVYCLRGGGPAGGGLETHSDAVGRETVVTPIPGFAGGAWGFDSPTPPFGDHSPDRLTTWHTSDESMTIM